VWFDVLWRPILEREWDNSSPSGTQRFERRTFDYRANEIFKSYPSASIVTINDLSAGRTRAFDALDRLVTEQAPTELGTSTTSYAYVAPFETRVTSPRNFEARLRYFALNEPSIEYPVRVERGINGPASEQSLTVIARDIWGKVLSMERSGNGTTATRTLLYDAQQRLCQLTEPESGAQVMEYDLGGNVAWTAEGRTPAGTCTAARSGVPASAQIGHTYDRRNRLTHINYPDSPNIPTSDVVMTYAGDGAVLTSSMGNVTLTYTYNSLRRVESEEMAFDSRTFLADWQYDTLGTISGLTYPNGEAATFLPNALGQQTRSGTFVTGAIYHPNGAAAGWTFGNGIVRSVTQTLRKLPDQLRDVGGAVIFDEDYNYDPGANVTNIVDARDSLQSRTLTYDAQDRLSTAVGPWGSGALAYDGADNLKTQVLGAKNYTYNYTQQKLQTVTNGAQTLISFLYDARGNQTQKNTQALTWDIANRVAIAPGKARYRYDSHGRRVLIEKLTPAGVATGERTVQFYSREGGLLYEERSGVTLPELGLIFSNGFEVYGVPPSGPVDKTTYHYLGRTLVARKDTSASNQVSTTYVHTDALGSVMAETNPSQVVTRRVNYQPFGLPGGSVVDGPGYTGHVFDTATSLLYMQGRYYDPDVGRFLSMDPAAPSAIDGADFNRYAYANGNPYRFVDPDGREAVFSFSNGATFWDAVSTVRYLMRSPTARGEFRQLTDSKQTYRLVFDRGKDAVMSYDHDTRTVTINPTSGLRVGAKGEIQSPAIGAGHEVSHAAEHDRIGTEALVKNLEAPVVEVEMTPDGGMSVTYDVSPEEQRATAVEGKIAKELGEPIRSSYTERSTARRSCW
jgi:RHS repeat-associated protein